MEGETEVRNIFGTSSLGNGIETSDSLYLKIIEGEKVCVRETEREK